MSRDVLSLCHALDVTETTCGRTTQVSRADGAASNCRVEFR